MSNLRKVTVDKGAVIAGPTSVARGVVDAIAAARDVDIDEGAVVLAWPDGWTPEEVAKVLAAARAEKEQAE